eukprot:CAMPEP_0185730186 /NCGR_PEP_ID=MMETSP1171-20130828/8789_1 /TAXON_ID=374046 /ORGANISM="Helicotheca tamensis, Strain CCMP826" /LENGTH=317 /DNA_ID=CAMNT_0028399187 /DNA_START=88 /DNA_END=1041 /DNA_ORIENTATION=-
MTMPMIGLGTMSLNGPDIVGPAIQSAISLGYKRIDCAPVYFNEEHIGDALQNEFNKGSIKREGLFLTSKLASPFHKREHVEPALRKTLSDLRVDYLDLFLIHWPVAFHPVPIDFSMRGWADESADDSDGGKNIDPSVTVKETWTAMEDLVEKGLVRNIGVSNFPVALLHELMAGGKIKPAVNQVEIHPYLQQQKLIDYCKARGVHVQAYSPMGTSGYKEPDEPSVLNDPVLSEIAKKRGISVAQLCLAWSMQRGCSVVAKSASPKRQEENIMVEKGWPDQQSQLSGEEMKRIAELDRGYRFFRPEDWWGSMAMAVFD